MQVKKLQFEPVQEVARVYIRVSKLRDEGESLSPEVQLNHARAICLVRGWKLDEEASLANQDLDVSGYSISWRKREGMLGHYRDAQKGKFSRLLVYRLDRLGRQTRDSLDCIDSFAAANTSVFSISENIDSGSDHGALLRTILFAVAEQESRNTSARVRAACEQRAKNGLHHGGRSPNWLRWDKATRSYEVIEHVAEAVRYLIDLRLRGHSYVETARLMNDAGFRTQGGLLWHRSMVVKYCRTDWIESMLGTAYLRRAGRWMTDPTTKQRKSRGEPIAIPNSYPPIIDEETGHRLISMMTRQKALYAPWNHDTHHPQGRYSGKASYLLSGLLRCAECGGTMMPHRREDKSRPRTRRSYYCYDAKLLTERIPHTRTIIDGDLIEEAVLLAIHHLVAAAAKKKAQSQGQSKKIRVRSMADVQREMDRVLALYAKGIVAELDLERTVNRLNAERETIQREQRETKANEEEFAKLDLTRLTRSEAKVLLQRLISKIEYPVYLPEVVNDNKSSKRPDSPKPCVRLTFDNDRNFHHWVIPIYRQAYKGLRWMYSYNIDGKRVAKSIIGGGEFVFPCLVEAPRAGATGLLESVTPR